MRGKLQTPVGWGFRVGKTDFITPFRMLFALNDVREWKPLQESYGEILETPAFTALSGTVFHTVNTERGWSGTPLFREGTNGRLQITAAHIVAAPSDAPRNIAVSAPFVTCFLDPQEVS